MHEGPKEYAFTTLLLKYGIDNCLHFYVTLCLFMCKNNH